MRILIFPSKIWANVCIIHCKTRYFIQILNQAVGVVTSFTPEEGTNTQEMEAASDERGTRFQGFNGSICGGQQYGH